MQQINHIFQLQEQYKTALLRLSDAQKRKLTFYERMYNNSEIRKNYASDCVKKELQKHQINALRLLSLETPLELCRLLKTSFSQLETIINLPAYEHYTILKKRGGERHIFAPEERLKEFQRRLNFFLQSYYLWIKPAEAHGFTINPRYARKQCNIVQNAAAHTNKKYILNIDLKDFFPSISAQRIKNLFTSPVFNYSEQLAIALTLLCTYKSQLPIGAPTSPVLSNFICLPLDSALRNYCQKNNLHYTRYADDITFSSNEYFPQEIISEIKELIKKNNFEVNNKKVHLQSAQRKQSVTGLTVNQKVNVDRKLLKKIRAMLHDFCTNDIHTATLRHFKLKESVSEELCQHFLFRLSGYINFVGQVRGKNDAIYLKMSRQFVYGNRKSSII